jgi:metal-sulfur cluster biosynthetic enzyme
MSANEPNMTTSAPQVSAEDADLTGRIWETLQTVYDPELHADVVNLGLIYGVTVEQGAANVKMTFTSPGCPYGPYLAHQVREAVRGIPGIRSVQLEVVFDPPWSPLMMNEELRLDLGLDL